MAGSVKLTDAEIQVMDRICEGASNSKIAEARGTSRKTVKNQVHNILNKLGAVNRTHAVTIWLSKPIK